MPSVRRLASLAQRRAPAAQPRRGLQTFTHPWPPATTSFHDSDSSGPPHRPMPKHSRPSLILQRQQFLPPSGVSCFALRPAMVRAGHGMRSQRGLAVTDRRAGVAVTAAAAVGGFLRRMYQDGPVFRWKGVDFHNSMQVPFYIRDTGDGRGDGLFATETVEEGQVVFHEKDVFEQKIPHSEVVDFLRGLPVAEARNILHHSYAQDDMFHWCKDTVALFNHSDEPTVVPDGELGSDSTVWRATRRIDVDDEFVFDYCNAFEGEPAWFAELFPLVLEEDYPDHAEWS